MAIMVDGDDCRPRQFYVEREVVVAQHDQKRLPTMAIAIQNESRKVEKRASSLNNNNDKNSHSHSGVVGYCAYPYRSAQAFRETCRSICSSEQSRHVALHNNDEGALRPLDGRLTEYE